MTFNKYYPFQVWISILLGGSILGIVLNVLRRPDTFEMEYVFAGPFILTIGGAFVSLPAFMIYYLVYRILREKMESALYMKFIFCPVLIAGVISTIYFLISDEMLIPSNKDGFLLVKSYAFSAPVSTFLFKKYKSKLISGGRRFIFWE